MLHKVYILDKKFDLNIFQEGERYYDMIFCSWPWIVVSRSTKIISLKLSEWFQSYQQGLSPVFSRHACVFSHVTMTMHQLALQHLSALNVTLIKNSKCSFGHETSRQSCVYVITSLLNDCLWTCPVRAPSSVIGMQSKASGSFNNVILFVGPEAKVVTQTWTRCVTVEFQPVLLLTFFCISVFVVKNYSKFFPHD